MTQKEFNQKLEAYKISDAPVEVKEAYIKELEELYYGRKLDNETLVENGDLSDLEGGY